MNTDISSLVEGSIAYVSPAPAWEGNTQYAYPVRVTKVTPTRLYVCPVEDNKWARGAVEEYYSRSTGTAMASKYGRQTLFPPSEEMEKRAQDTARAVAAEMEHTATARRRADLANKVAGALRRYPVTEEMEPHLQALLALIRLMDPA